MFDVGIVSSGMIFTVLYVVVVIYTLMQLSGINKALQRIASALARKQE